MIHMCALRSVVSQFAAMSLMQLHGYERLVMVGDGATDLEVRDVTFPPTGKKHDTDF